MPSSFSSFSSSSSRGSVQRLALSGLLFLASAAARPNDRPSISDVSIPSISLLGGDVALRILPLGDILTHGTPASPSSYRAALRDLLAADGNPVDYVGSSTSGSLDDNQVEAPSAVGTSPISEILASAEIAVPAYKPNLVIVNAGTDDCRQGKDVSDASAGLLKILETSWNKSIFASVVLTTLVPSKDATVETCLQKVNEQIADLVAAQQARSRKVVLVDFRAADKGVTADDLTEEVDGEFFPSAEAYERMAALLFDGINSAASRGWLEAPEPLPETPVPSPSPSGNGTSPSATGTGGVSVPTAGAGKAGEGSSAGNEAGGEGGVAEEAEAPETGGQGSGAVKVGSGFWGVMGLVVGLGLAIL